jgi:hypothetical protein
VRSRQVPPPSGRRYGGADNVPRQGLTGIWIVALTSLSLAAVGFGLAVVVSLVF